MKNKKTAAAIITAILAVSTAALVGCGDDDKPTKKPPKEEKLATPVLELAENVVSWGEVAHASGYVVRVNDKAEVTVTTTSYAIEETEPAEYTVYVRATAESGSGYISSDEASIKYTVTRPEPQKLMLTANPAKTSYFLDETCGGGKLDTTGLAVQLKYDNGDMVSVTPTVGEVDLTKAGYKTVPLSYTVDGKTFETSFVVTVRERTELDIGSSLVKKTYEYENTAAEHRYLISDGEVTAVDMTGKAVEVTVDGGKSYIAFDGSKSMLLKVTGADGVSFIRVTAAYYVRTEEDFMSINNDLSASYVLANDIVLDGRKEQMIGAVPLKAARGYDDDRPYAFDKDGHSSFDEDGNPIEESAGGAPFTGTFDGNGYAVSGYKHDCGGDWTLPGSMYQGLFAYIGEGAVVENFTLRASSFSGGRVTGLIAGVNFGTVKNVVVDDDCVLYSNYNTGGLIAYNCGAAINIVSMLARGGSGYGGFDITAAAEKDTYATAENIFVGKSGDLTGILGDGWFYVKGLGTVYGNDSYKKVVSMPATMFEAASSDLTADIKVYQKTMGEVAFIAWINGAPNENLVSYVGYDENEYVYRVKLNVTDDLSAGDTFKLGVKSVDTGLYIGIKDVTVGEPFAVGAEYKGEPLSVMQNTFIVLNSISLEVTYSDGTKQTATPVKLEGFDNTAAVGSKQNVKLFYGSGADQYTTVEVTITEVTGVVATSITAVAKDASAKITVDSIDGFDIFDYYTLTVGYSDGSSKTLAKGDVGLTVGTVKAGLNSISLGYTDGAAVTSTVENVAVWQKISTVEQFDGMNDNLAGYYILANDLDFNNTEHKISSVVTKVSGGDTVIDTEAAEDTAFTGKFDGGGHTISGWKTAYETGWSAQYFGYSMFAFIGTGGEVGNFTLSNFAASACNYHAFVSSLNRGRIYDVTIDASCTIRCNWGSAAAFAAINNGVVQNSTCAVAKFTKLNGKYEGEQGVTQETLNAVCEGNKPID